MGMRLARGAVPEHLPGRIICHGVRSTAEAATFVNTAMIRNLDFNDEYPGGHPSDCLGAFFAIAETAGADGRRLIESLVIAYELFLRLSDATGLRYKGWDQGFAIGIGTAAGVSHMLNFSREQLAQAIAIVTVLGPGLQNALLAIGIVSIPAYARVVRASVLSVREMEFVSATRALGGNSMQVLFRRILPNALTPLIVYGTLGIATAILDAAAPGLAAPSEAPDAAPALDATGSTCRS